MALGPVAANLESATRAGEFTAICACLLATAKSGGLPAAHALAEADRLGPRVCSILKSAVAVGGLTTAWGSQIAEFGQAVSAFFDSLRNVGAFDTLLPSMKRVPMHSRVVLVTAGAIGALVPEAQVKPISSLALSGATTNTLKALAIIVAADELLKHAASGSSDLFARELKNAVALVTDTQFLSVLTTGISPITSNGSGAPAIANDFKSAIDAIPTGQQSKLFAITTSTIAKAWSTRWDSSTRAFPDMTATGGSMFGIPVIVSDAVTAGQIIFVDANSVAAGSSEIELNTTTHASFQLDTAPDSPPTASTNMISLFQHNQTALKAVRHFSAERIRDDAVAVVSGVSYGGNSPD